MSDSKEIIIYDEFDRPIETRATARDTDGWFHDWAMGGSTPASGERVNESTAMGLPALYAAVRNISEDIAKLPRILYEPDGDAGKKALNQHPVSQLVRLSPNPNMTAMSFWQTIMGHALIWPSGGIAKIDRNTGGEVTALWPIHPSKVTIVTGAGIEPVVYRVTNTLGGVFEFTEREVFHLIGPSDDGLRGMSPVTTVREAIGGALGAQKFSAAFFGNGATIGGVLEHPAKLSDEAFGHLREQEVEEMTGAHNAWKWRIAEEGMTFKPTTSDPERSQLIQTQNFYVETMARLARIPQHKVGHMAHASFSNIDAQNVEYLTDTLIPWAERIEQELDRKLLSQIEQDRGLFFEHDTRRLMRGDLKAQAEWADKIFKIGALNSDEVRRDIGMNPLPDGQGETYYVQNILEPVELLVKKREAELEQLKKANKEPAPESAEAVPMLPAPVDDDEEVDSVRACVQVHRPAILEAIKGILRHENDIVLRNNGSDVFWDKHTCYVESKIRAPVGALMDGLCAFAGYEFNGETEAMLRKAAESHVYYSRNHSGTNERIEEQIDLLIREICSKPDSNPTSEVKLCEK